MIDEQKITEFSMDFFSLKGKNAIVTGGNTGLGQAFSMALAKAGANIYVTTIMDGDGSFKKMIEDTGAKYEEIKADITKDGACQEVVEGCVKKYGSVDILVNCAGVCINIQNVLEFTRKQWDKMIAINLTAAFDMSHECAKFMIPQKSGKIINICSVFTYLGGQWSPAYAASKHGIAGLTKSYADEVAQFGINVNGIAPGYFATPLTTATRSNPVTNQRVLDHIAAGRWGLTSDLMGATVFLASKAADYAHGTILNIDGGYLLR